MDSNGQERWYDFHIWFCILMFKIHNYSFYLKKKLLIDFKIFKKSIRVVAWNFFKAIKITKLELKQKLLCFLGAELTKRKYNSVSKKISINNINVALNISFAH